MPWQVHVCNGLSQPIGGSMLAEIDNRRERNMLKLYASTADYAVQAVEA